MSDPATPGRARRVLRRTVTALSGVLLLGAAGTAALAGQWWPAEQATVEPQVVPVAASTTSQVCPGPPRLATAAAGEDLGYDEFDPEGSGTESVLRVVTLGRDGQPPPTARLLPALDAGTGTDLALSGDARTAARSDVGEATVLEADPSGQDVALATGTGAALTAAGDLRGLSSAPCLSPGSSAWLVGGSTEPGSSAQLVLSNTGATAAGVTLRGWGSTGPVDMSGAGTVLVPPHGQRVVLLEAVVAAEPRLALQVTATGGEVTAVVQDTRLRGLVPAGTDLVVPGAAPAEQLLVPGVVLGETSGEGEDAPAVRIVNPGEEPVTAALDLLGEDGAVPVPGADALVVDPGAVVDVSLTGMPAGTWTAQVTADGPVVGAATYTTVGTAAEEGDLAPVDRTWAPATTAMTDGVVAVPEQVAATATLVLAAEQDADVELVPVLADGGRGEPLRRSLPAGSSLREDITALAEETVVAVEVTADAPLHGALVLSAQAPDGTLLSALPLTEDARTARAVTLAPAPSTLG